MIGNTAARAIGVASSDGATGAFGSGVLRSGTRRTGTLRSGVLLQSVESEGGSPLVVGLVLAALVLAAILSVAIAYRLYVGYRGSGDRSMLAIAVGLLLITTVPTAIRIVLPTALGGEQTVRVASTTVSEIVGLLAIVYAVRTPTRTRRRVERLHGSIGPPLAVVLAGVLQDATLAIQAPTPVVGSYVTWLAIRGYRRNDSPPMAFLGFGIALLTVTPFLTTVVLGQVIGTTDAVVLLGVSVSQLTGLVAVYYSLTRA